MSGIRTLQNFSFHPMSYLLFRLKASNGICIYDVNWVTNKMKISWFWSKYGILINCNSKLSRRHCLQQTWAHSLLIINGTMNGSSSRSGRVETEKCMKITASAHLWEIAKKGVSEWEREREREKIKTLIPFAARGRVFLLYCCP